MGTLFSALSIARSGMQTLNQSLARLVEAKKISVDTAFANSGDINELRVLMENVSRLSKDRAADPVEPRQQPLAEGRLVRVTDPVDVAAHSVPTSTTTTSVSCGSPR